MLAEYKTKTNIGVGIGILIQIVARTLINDAQEISVMIGFALLIVGAGFFLYGCISYSRGKGHHGGWGILGLLSIFGLLILFFLKDKHKEN